MWDAVNIKVTWTSSLSFYQHFVWLYVFVLTVQAVAQETAPINTHHKLMHRTQFQYSVILTRFPKYYSRAQLNKRAKGTYTVTLRRVHVTIIAVEKQ